MSESKIKLCFRTIFNVLKAVFCFVIRCLKFVFRKTFAGAAYLFHAIDNRFSESPVKETSEAGSAEQTTPEQNASEAGSSEQTTSDQNAPEKQKSSPCESPKYHQRAFRICKFAILALSIILFFEIVTAAVYLTLSLNLLSSLFSILLILPITLLLVITELIHVFALFHFVRFLSLLFTKTPQQENSPQVRRQSYVLILWFALLALCLYILHWNMPIMTVLAILSIVIVTVLYLLVPNFDNQAIETCLNMSPHESHHLLFQICEFAVIIICFCYLYQYVPIWTILAIIVFLINIAILALVRSVKNKLTRSGLQNIEKKPEIVHSFHFKNAVIGYWYYVMLLLLSVTFSIVTYCTIVDRQYRKIYDSYLKANVIWDALSQNAAFPDDLTKRNFKISDKGKYERCLIELMRDMKLLNADDYLVYNDNGEIDESKLGDHPKAVKKILEISKELKPIKKESSPTIQYLVRFSQILGNNAKQDKIFGDDSAAEENNNKQNKDVDGWTHILAAIYAQQPGIYNRSLKALNSSTALNSTQTNYSVNNRNSNILVSSFDQFIYNLKRTEMQKIRKKELQEKRKTAALSNKPKNPNPDAPAAPAAPATAEATPAPAAAPATAEAVPAPAAAPATAEAEPAVVKQTSVPENPPLDLENMEPAVDYVNLPAEEAPAAPEGAVASAEEVPPPETAEPAVANEQNAQKIADNQDSDSSIPVYKINKDFSKGNENVSEAEKQATQKIMKGYGDEYSIVNFDTRWNYFKIMDWFFKPEPITDELTLRLVYTVLDLSDVKILNMGSNSESENVGDDELSRQDYYFIRSWCANLISMLNDNAEVKKQKMYLSVIHGPEQFGMLLVFFLSFFIMIGRLIMFCWNRFAFFNIHVIGNQSRSAILQNTNTSPEVQKQLADKMDSVKELYIDQLYPELLNAYNAEGKDKQTKMEDLSDMLDYSFSLSNAMEQRSRWIINWCAAALPSIGFIGTVRGLLLALGDADSIVRASNALGQAAAITSVATQLSLAFTTTLVALLLGLVISLFNYWQVKAERNYLSLMDYVLRNHFNIWGQFKKTRN